MSDGPHRSLPLRHAWKQLAKRADRWAFENQDVVDAVCSALERDCALELPREFMRQLDSACAEEGPSLFARSLPDDLDELRRAAAGRGTLGNAIADFATQALLDGLSGADAVRQALRDALTDRLLRNARQIEEHYHREASSRRGSDIRARLERAIAATPVNVLAERLTLRPPSPKAVPPKRDGLDDGVGLP